MGKSKRTITKKTNEDIYDYNKPTTQKKVM
jgi:hypothetical protein